MIVLEFFDEPVCFPQSPRIKDFVNLRKPFGVRLPIVRPGTGRDIFTIFPTGALRVLFSTETLGLRFCIPSSVAGFLLPLFLMWFVSMATVEAVAIWMRGS